MFFVVKQKTAYEMRISDWSSDVCSSDLGLQSVVQFLQVFHAGVEGYRDRLQYDIVGEGFRPFFNQGFDCGAMRAGVGKEFQHLDLALCIRRLSGFQRDVRRVRRGRAWRSE